MYNAEKKCGNIKKGKQHITRKREEKPPGRQPTRIANSTDNNARAQQMST
jgi:hypothetical protein